MKPNESRESIIKRRGYRKDIQGDNFSLYISNYPIVVEYLKKRIGDKEKIIAELCCGVGVSLEYIGDSFKHIIGIDINKKILSQCADNLRTVGLLDKTTLIQGDVNDDEVLNRINADIVIYDVPFWSPHESQRKKDLTNDNPSLKSVINKIRKFISQEIVIFAPPNYDYELIKKQVGICEYQKVFINGKYDRNHIYLGKLVKDEGINEIELFT